MLTIFSNKISKLKKNCELEKWKFYQKWQFAVTAQWKHKLSWGPNQWKIDLSEHLSAYQTEKHKKYLQTIKDQEKKLQSTLCMKMCNGK